jgi:pimeloyl-ACP methyl ester carboxylesterase
MAIANPERVSRLVLIGTGFTGTNPVLLDLQKSLRDLPDPVPPEFAREFQASTAFRPLPKAFFDEIIVETLKLPSRLWRVIIDGLLAYNDAAELPRIAAPTLLLWGDKDALFTRAYQDQFIAAIPDTKLTIYKETGHCPNWEEPERVAADIAEFAGK